MSCEGCGGVIADSGYTKCVSCQCKRSKTENWLKVKNERNRIDLTVIQDAIEDFLASDFRIACGAVKTDVTPVAEGMSACSMSFVWVVRDEDLVQAEDEEF